MSTSPSGWYPDPSGRHEHRYWHGDAWTNQVADSGEVTHDDPGPAGELGLGRLSERLAEAEASADRFLRSAQWVPLHAAAAGRRGRVGARDAVA